MKIKKSDIEAVAVRPSQSPPDNLKEIAFAGRSNVGKSSLLNLLTGRRKLAKVSSSPGKTRTINFYVINDAFRIVDLPGYGYAKVSRNVSAEWGEMIEQYLTGRQNLVKVIQLVDIRHAPGANDRQMYEWIAANGYEPVIIATKLDKLNRSERQKADKIIRGGLGIGPDVLIFPYSAETQEGREAIYEYLEEKL